MTFALVLLSTTPVTCAVLVPAPVQTPFALAHVIVHTVSPEFAVIVGVPPLTHRLPAAPLLPGSSATWPAEPLVVEPPLIALLYVTLNCVAMLQVAVGRVGWTVSTKTNVCEVPVI